MSDQTNLSDAKRSLLAKYLRGEMARAPENRTRIVARPTSAVAPLSLSQQQVWLHHHIAPDDAPVYNETLTIHRSGPLHVRAIERTFAEIIRRHEIWRTTFEMIEGRPVQIIHPPETDFTLRLIHLNGLPEATREHEAVRLAREQAVRPFDLSTGPLMRALLVKLTEDQHRLFLTFHQLIFDGVTAYRVFLPELAAVNSRGIYERSFKLPRKLHMSLRLWKFSWWFAPHSPRRSARQVSSVHKKLPNSCAANTSASNPGTFPEYHSPAIIGGTGGRSSNVANTKPSAFIRLLTK